MTLEPCGNVRVTVHVPLSREYCSAKSRAAAGYSRLNRAISCSPAEELVWNTERSANDAVIERSQFIVDILGSYRNRLNEARSLPSRSGRHPPREDSMTRSAHVHWQK